jgi:hypothetical protein
LGVAQRALTASSENPGTFTASGADDWIALTVAAAPATTVQVDLKITPSLTDTVTVADVASAFIEGEVALTVSVSDSVGVADAATVTPLVLPDVGLLDSVTVVDAPTAYIAPAGAMPMAMDHYHRRRA